MLKYPSKLSVFTETSNLKKLQFFILNIGPWCNSASTHTEKTLQMIRELIRKSWWPWYNFLWGVLTVVFILILLSEYFLSSFNNKTCFQQVSMSPVSPVPCTVVTVNSDLKLCLEYLSPFYIKDVCVLNFSFDLYE